MVKSIEYPSSEVRSALNRDVVKAGTKMVLPAMVFPAMLVALPLILVPVLTKRLEWLSLAAFPLLVGMGVGLKVSRNKYAEQEALRLVLKSRERISFLHLWQPTAKQAWPTGLKKSE